MSFRRVLALILVLRFTLALYFSILAPFSETLDEWNHLQYALFLATEQRLPTKTDYPNNIPSDYQHLIQYEQAPLYYLLTATVFVALGQTAMPPEPIPNPAPVCEGMVHDYYLHDSISESPQLRQAFGIGRFFNIVLGVLSVGLSAYAVRAWFPKDEKLALYTAACFALYPAAIWGTSWMNNDNLLSLWGAVFFLALGHFTNGKTKAFLWILVAVFGALFTKLSGFVLFPVAALALLVYWAWGKPKRLVLLFVLLFTILFAYTAFNWSRCGQVLCRLHRYEHYSENWEQFLYYLQRPNYLANLASLVETSTVPALLNHREPELYLHLIGSSLIIFGCLGTGVVWIWQKATRRALTWAGLVLLASLGLVFLRVWWFPYSVLMPVRYLSISFPAVALLFAIGWRYWAEKYAAIALIPLVWMFFITIISPLAFHQITNDNIIIRSMTNTEIPLIADESLPVYFFDYQLDERGIWLYWQARTQAIYEPLYLQVDLYGARNDWLGSCSQSLGGASHNAVIWGDEIVGQLFLFSPEILAEAEILEWHLYATEGEHVFHNQVAPEALYSFRLQLFE